MFLIHSTILNPNNARRELKLVFVNQPTTTLTNLQKISKLCDGTQPALN